MAECFRTKLNREAFDRMQVYYPSNLVLVQMDKEKDLETNSGIKVNFNPDLEYGLINEEDRSSHIADNAAVMGIIIKQVDRLYYLPKDTARTMSWDTDVETRVHDIVWFHAMASKNANEIEVDGIVYKSIRYEDLYVAKRLVKVDSIPEIWRIPLNGNIILETVLKPKISKLDVRPDEIDMTRGIVRWNGTNNRSYETGAQADMKGLKKGDLVMIDQKGFPTFLERSRWNSHFDEGRQYLVIQKRYVLGVIDKN